MPSIKLTKKSKNDMYNQHSGTGTIVYKSAENEIRYVDFYISRKTFEMLNIRTGQPIRTLDFIEEL